MTTGQILGLVTGIVFGALLQRGGVIRFEKQVGMLLFRDMTVLRFMLSAIAIGMLGVTALSQAGIITLGHKPMNVGGVVVGASLFGIGWAITGLCPGTAMGALGEGRVHAIFTVAGMLAGAMLYAHTYGFLEKTVLAWGDYGKIGLPDALGISPLITAAICVIAIVLLLRELDKKEL